MRRFTIAAIAALGGALLATGMTAASAAPGGGRGFDRLDADGDGALSEAEIEGRRSDMFKAADANGDGKLTREEMEAHHRKMQAERLGDANGDGRISRREFEDQARERFQRLDADGNGELTEDELRAGHRKGRGRDGR